MNTVVRAEGLTKRYGVTLALDSLDLSVRAGEVYGYLGPNGSGKTTTIRLLLGLHRPSAGRVDLFGLDAWHSPVAAHREVAYVAGEPFLWPALTGEETFEFLAQVRGGTDGAYRDILIERFKLDPAKKVRALSKGNRQKVQLIAAFASRAQLLILDEPTSGLDPLMEVAFRQTVNEAKERGQTIFLSSHILSEVEALCDRVGILREGRLIDEGTLSELRHLSVQTLDVTFAGAPPSFDGLPGVEVTSAGPNALHFEVTGEITQLIDALAGHPVVALNSRQPSLRRSFYITTTAPAPMPAASDTATEAAHGSTATDLTAARALAGRAFRDARVRTASFGCLFVLIAYIQPLAYRHAYPTLSSRLLFARSFAENKAVRLFYGVPHNLLTVSGYSAWRVGGTLAIFAAVFGLLAAVRALRTEEDTGRMELVLAGPVGRRTAYISAMAAIAAGVAILGLAEFAGLVLAGLPVRGSAALALATASVVPVFVGVGAVMSQLAPTRRVALELGGAVVGLFLMLRVVADTSSGAGWLRWTTPLGWAEEVRPFTGIRIVVLLLPAVTTVLLLVAAARIAAARDIGSGILPARDSSEPRLGLLSSSTAQALRSERGSLIVWLGSVGAFAFVDGVIAKSTSSAGISKSLQREAAKLGSGSIVTPSGYIAFVFIFYVLAVSLFMCTQVGAARHEEAGGRLETLLSMPLGRDRWLGGRLLLATGAAVVISLTAGLLSWAGAESGGVSISLPRMLEAGANCMPAAVLFLSRLQRWRNGRRAQSERRDCVWGGHNRVLVGPLRRGARRAEMARGPDAV